MIPKEYKLTLTYDNNEINLIYRGNENILVQDENGYPLKHVPRMILEKFIEMINL